MLGVIKILFLIQIDLAIARKNQSHTPNTLHCCFKLFPVYRFWIVNDNWPAGGVTIRPVTIRGSAPSLSDLGYFSWFFIFYYQRPLQKMYTGNPYALESRV